jgi:hypothetical protein
LVVNRNGHVWQTGKKIVIRIREGANIRIRTTKEMYGVRRIGMREGMRRTDLGLEPSLAKPCGDHAA